MKLPTLKELNPIPCEEGGLAASYFSGKSLAQAEAMFKSDLRNYTESLGYMGSKAFLFYIDALMSYLEGPDSVGDDEVLSSLLSAFAIRRSEELRLELQLVKKSAALVDMLLLNWDKFVPIESHGIDYSSTKADWQKLRIKFATILSSEVS